jgi:multidrug resistance protein, MATE family
LFILSYCIAGLSIIIGLSSALETLCGQAYGAQNFPLLGIYMQRSVVLTTCVAALISLAWSQAGPLLQLLGQSPTLATQAAHYIQILIPALFLTCVSESIRRFLVSQSIVRPTMLISGVVTLLSLPLNYFLIFVLNWGLLGAAATVVLCNLATTLLIIGYVLTVGREKCSK